MNPAAFGISAAAPSRLRRRRRSNSIPNPTLLPLFRPRSGRYWTSFPMLKWAFLFLVAVGIASFISSRRRDDFTLERIAHAPLIALSPAPVLDSADAAVLGDSTTFLLGIFSTLSEKEKRRRDLIRETYLSKVVASSAVCSLPDFENWTFDRRKSCRVVYVFVVGANPDGPVERLGSVDKNESMTIEAPAIGAIAERDVAYLNIKENMDEGKTPTWFALAASLADRHGFDYVAKADSDAQINTDELIRLIREDLPPLPHGRRTYGGQTRINFSSLGIYMAGEFYFVSADLARYVTRILSTEQRAQLRNGYEDMDFGAWALSHPKPIKMTVLSNCIFWNHPVKEESQWHMLWENIKALPATHRERMLCMPDWARVIITFLMQNEDERVKGFDRGMLF